MAKTFRVTPRCCDESSNKEKEQKKTKKKKRVSTVAPYTRPECLTGWTQNSTFKAKSESKRHETKVIKLLHTFKMI